MADVPGIMARSFLRTMHRPSWTAAALVPEARAWMLLLDLTEALHPLGTVTIPSTALIRRIARDESIRQQFRGHNHDALAREYGLSSRQIRRIVERRR